MAHGYPTDPVDEELERARSCPTRACIDELLASPPSAGSATWARAIVTRAVRPAQNGCVELEISAEVPGLVRKISATTRIWRP